MFELCLMIHKGIKLSESKSHKGSSAFTQFSSFSYTVQFSLLVSGSHCDSNFPTWRERGGDNLSSILITVMRIPSTVFRWIPIKLKGTTIHIVGRGLSLLLPKLRASDLDSSAEEWHITLPIVKTRATDWPSESLQLLTTASSSVFGFIWKLKLLQIKEYYYVTTVNTME